MGVNGHTLGLSRERLREAGRYEADYSKPMAECIHFGETLLKSSATSVYGNPAQKTNYSGLWCLIVCSRSEGTECGRARAFLVIFLVTAYKSTDHSVEAARNPLLLGQTPPSTKHLMQRIQSLLFFLVVGFEFVSGLGGLGERLADGTEQNHCGSENFSKQGKVECLSV